MNVEKAGPEDVEALVHLRISYLTEDNGSLDARDLAAVKNGLPAYFRAHLNRDLLENGILLQYSCLKNFMDRGAWGYSPWTRKRIRQN